MAQMSRGLKHALYLGVSTLPWTNPINPPIFEDLHVAFYLHSDEKGLYFGIRPVGDGFVPDPRIFNEDHPILKAHSLDMLVELASFEDGDPVDNTPIKSKLNAVLDAIDVEGDAISNPGLKVGKWTMGVVKKLHAQGLLMCPDTGRLEEELVELWEKHGSRKAVPGSDVPVVKAKSCCGSSKA